MAGNWKKYTFFDKETVSEKVNEILVSLLIYVFIIIINVFISFKGL